DLLILADGQHLTIKPQARMIVEIRGKYDADRTSDSLIIPEILAGFGLCFADYLEWRKSTYGMLSDFELKRALRSHVKATWNYVSQFAKSHEMDLRRAAVTLAVSRVAE